MKTGREAFVPGNTSIQVLRPSLPSHAVLSLGDWPVFP